MNEKDILDEFIVDENVSLDKNLLAEIIKPFIHSIGKNEIIDYREKFDGSPNWIKIAIYLCCRKIMENKNIINNEKIGPREIAKKLNISESAAKDISRHKNLKKIVLNEKGKYSIPNYKLKKVGEMLSNNETNSKS